jgi:hypothetical protein
MATPILADRNAWNTALKYIWSQYRTWALTSRAYKAEVSNWRNTVLILSIAGAICGTLCQQSRGWNLNESWTWFPGLFGILSAAALGLAAYFTREALSPDPEGRAVRARSAAEAFKSEAYLLAANAPPYNTATTVDEVRARTDKVRTATENLSYKTITAEQELKGMPSAPLSVKDYIEQRVDEQLHRYYIPQALQNEKKVARGRRLSLILGALAVVLGVLGTTRYGWLAGWVAVISTITAAIAARQYAGRYQFLIVSYQATAERLKWLKTQWEISRKTDADVDERNKFITACEETISIENSAWMAEWTKKADSAG